MAVGWIGLLKRVPWGDVVSNAPKIADGARSLWGTVSKKMRADEPVTPAKDEPQSDTLLAARITTLENQHRELQRQLASASGLIDSLAEQNNQLVAQLQAFRTRLRWMTLGLLVVGGLTALSLLKGF